VFGRDVSKAYRTARWLRAGTVWVNTWNVFDAVLLFGGYRVSGRAPSRR
jgi:phenylacetaldehyde dehydrogenase